MLKAANNETIVLPLPTSPCNNLNIFVGALKSWLISLIKDILKKNRLSFLLFTNRDIHLNESPNLELKDIYNLTGFDCSRGYLLIFDDKIVFFTDSRYTLAAHKHFKSSVLIFDLQEYSIPDYLNNLGINFNGGIDSKLISVSEFNLISKKLEKNNIKIIPFKNLLLKQNTSPSNRGVFFYHTIK